MRHSSVAHKYARALFDSAREDGRLDRVGADMESLARLGQEDPAFLTFLVSPEVLTEHKMEFVGAVFGPRVDPLTANFLRLIVERGRIDHLPGMAGDFLRLWEEHLGKLKAEVLTAVPLDSDQEARLKAQLDRITGKDVDIEKRVDAGLLGGVVVHLGNRIIDRSLRHGLRQLQESLLEVEVN